MAVNLICRVIATTKARALLASLREKHGPLLFVQSGGCCDGHSPQCYSVVEFNTDNDEVYLGNLDGTPFYVEHKQFEFWQSAKFIVDVIDGVGMGDSLETGAGKRFLTRKCSPEDEPPMLADAQDETLSKNAGLTNRNDF